MPQIDLGKLRFDWKGTWSNSVTYELNDVVQYTDSVTNVYVALGDVTAGTLPTDTNSWALMLAGVDLSNYDTSSEVDTKIANLVDLAPGALDTLNELAAALGDDANFSTTVTNSLAEKAPLSQTWVALSANYTLQASDSGKVFEVTGTVTITVPAAVFTGGERIDIVNAGTGVITFVGSGMGIRSKDAALTIDTQYAAASIIYRNASVAYLIGDIA